MELLVDANIGVKNKAKGKTIIKNNGIEISNLTVKYNGKIAIESIFTEIESAKITGIIGPNGAGKSTLIKGLMKLVPTVSGEAYINNVSIEKLRKDIAYIEQRSALDLSFPINVFDTVLLGTYPKLGLFKRPKAMEREKASKALETVKMQDFAKRQIGELSGGQLQRVFIARALAQEADVFLLDEPFVGIDMVSEELIMEILFNLRNEGKAIAIVHHDLYKVKEYFDNIIILNKHLIADGKVSDVFTKEVIAKAYGGTWADTMFEEG